MLTYSLLLSLHHTKVTTLFAVMTRGAKPKLSSSSSNSSSNSSKFRLMTIGSVSPVHE